MFDATANIQYINTDIRMLIISPLRKRKKSVTPEPKNSRSALSIHIDNLFPLTFLHPHKHCYPYKAASKLTIVLIFAIFASLCNFPA